MNFAVIPWDDAGLRDQIFDTSESERNADHRLEPFYDMQQHFARRGDSFHTIDFYDDLRKVDYFLFFSLQWKWVVRLLRIGAEGRMVYCNAEPPTVDALNTPEGFGFLKRYFPYIMTWNDAWTDGKTIFKRHIPYYFAPPQEGLPFAERALLTCISGNKRSSHPEELYSERERVITFFEKKYPEMFRFYGTGWDRQKHPCYGGKARKKAEVYGLYKFAVCFENMKHIKGYVTEKILDCLTDGIVPVYAGAENIGEYVPPECFIDYWQFDSLEALDAYLQSVTQERFEMYRQAARLFLNSPAVTAFGGAQYAEDIYALARHPKSFRVSGGDRLLAVGKAAGEAGHKRVQALKSGWRERACRFKK